jgi:MoxR-like ATPase
MLFETTGATEAHAERVLDAEGIKAIQQLVRRMPVGESVVEAILNLVRSARPGEGEAKFKDAIAWGPGPRASQALMLAVRARALIDGRFAPSLDDVADLAEPVLKHRMALSFAARADGLTVGEVIAELKAKIA